MPIPDCSAAYAWYVVIVLMLCQALASVDARLPYILVEIVKRDLGLSDTEVGLITGPAFTLTYAICAIPIAKLSDRYNRVAIIGTAITLWCTFTALAGLTKGFGGFAFTRTGVAIGESALTPAAHSIIASYLQGPARITALALYAVGSGAGALLAFAVGGHIGERYGWRMAFILVGGAGLAMVALLAATVREPARETAPSAPAPGASLASLLHHPTVRHLAAGGALLGLSSGAISSWGPAYVMRSFGLSAAQTGLSYGAVIGLVAMAGTMAGGLATRWLFPLHPQRALRILSIMLMVGMATQFAALLTASYLVFLVLLALTFLLSSAYLAPTFATLHEVVDPRARSFASAALLFCISGIGVGSGALAAGVLSDLLKEWAGADSLKWSLAALTLAKAWSAWHYWQAGAEGSADTALVMGDHAD